MFGIIRQRAVFAVIGLAIPYIAASFPGRVEPTVSTIDVAHGFSTYHLGDEGKENFDIDGFGGFVFGELMSLRKDELRDEYPYGGANYGGSYGILALVRPSYSLWGKLSEPYGRLTHLTCNYSGSSKRLYAIRLHRLAKFSNDDEIVEEALALKKSIEEKYGIELKPYNTNFFSEVSPGKKVTSWAFSNKNVTFLVFTNNSSWNRGEYYVELCVIKYRIPREDYVKEEKSYRERQCPHGRMTLDDERNDLLLLMKKQIEELMATNRCLIKEIQMLKVGK